MLERIERRQLLESLENVRQGMLHSMAEQGGSRQILAEALESIKISCRQGLSDLRYAYYEEFLDGILLSLESLKSVYARDGRREIMFLCQDILFHVEQELQQEKEVKKDIVFLPYKASMWDSLESVWKAAYEDKEHCNAYVIPIPYCERNPDTSAAAWHCEREQFPKYVPTLNWEAVDLEAWHPDVIFIHNPYDEQNHVTSVDSRYYSRNLRNATDKLVYIPYAVEEEIQPGNEAVETSIEHRVLLPGIFNSHWVIAQSENMRQAWINILVRRTNVKERAYWEQRILGLGSPKIDKVLTSKKEEFEMPKKWRKQVKGKKVILYITSISPTLRYTDKVCDKLRCVFDTFRNRKDVILWWRPHPLMRATIHSMRPQYEDEYLSIERRYIEEGWGIYDDTADLHRAICWSDACYGDWSSVTTMYRKSYKPSMIQQLGYSMRTDYRLFFEFVALENGRFYGISQCGFVGLYEMNLTTDEIKCMGELPIRHRQPMGDIFEYVALGKSNNKVVSAPFNSRDGLIVYDMDKRSFKYIEIASKYFPDNAGAAFFVYSFKWGDSIFFVGNQNGVILEYDSITEKVVYHEKWSKEISECIGRERIAFERQGYVKKNGYIYMVVSRTNLIVRLDLKIMESSVYKIPDNYQALNLCYDGKLFWLTPRFGNFVMCWDESSNLYEKVKLPIEARDSTFLGSGVVGNDIILFPHMADYVLRINRDSLTVTRDIALENYLKAISTHKYGALGTGDGMLLAFLADRSIQEFDTDTGEMRIHQLKADLDEERKIRLASQYRQAQGIVSYEGEDLVVDLWMEMFLTDSQQIPKKPETRLAGQKIYEAL